MRKVVSIYKNIGETPLQALLRLRQKQPDLQGENMTYLGRLDPMAEGLLLVLVGDTSDKEEYLGLDKVYEFEVLWGLETDTYDPLGLLQGEDCVACSPPGPVRRAGWTSIGEVTINTILSQLKGKKSQKYPPYSSKKVMGKQLFEWARAGEEVERPSKEVEIYSIEYLGDREESGGELLEEIIEKVKKVHGDFRQDKIKKRWKEVLQKKEGDKFLISSFRAHVSSGTYIRSLAHEMGQKVGCGALAYSIKRTKVGEYSI